MILSNRQVEFLGDFSNRLYLGCRYDTITITLQDFRKHVILSDQRERKIPEAASCQRVFEGFFTSPCSVQNDMRKSCSIGITGMMLTNYDAIAEKYQKASDNPIKQYIESYSFLQQLGNIQGKSVLDLACGEGYYTRLVKQQGAMHVVGLDISEAMINQAQAVELAEPLGIEYLVQDVTKMGVAGAFDVVTAIYLFTYAATKEALTAMFRAIVANLKPGGKLVAITLNPHLRAEDTSIYPRYGIRMNSATFQDGEAITFTVDIPHRPNDSFDLIVTYWQQQTMEQTARRAGFQKINWQALQMSREGLEKSPKDHWQAFLEKPYSVLFTCYR